MKRTTGIRILSGQLIFLLIAFLACEDILNLSISAPDDLLGAHVLVNGKHRGFLERNGKSVELRIGVGPHQKLDIVVMKEGIRPIKRVVPARGPGREELIIYQNEIRFNGVLP